MAVTLFLSASRLMVWQAVSIPNLDVQPKLWDGKAGKAAGRSAEATRINRLLDDINASLNTIYHELQRRDNYVTAEKVKNEFLGS